MALTSSLTLHDGPRKVVRKVSVANASAAEFTDEVIVDLSTLSGTRGKTLSHLVIEEIWYSIIGFESVLIEFDATTDAEGLRLSGDGYLDLREYGGIVDTQASGFTGDILMTTAGADSGVNSANIVISCRKKYT